MFTPFRTLVYIFLAQSQNPVPLISKIGILSAVLGFLFAIAVPVRAVGFYNQPGVRNKEITKVSPYLRLLLIFYSNTFKNFSDRYLNAGRTCYIPCNPGSDALPRAESFPGQLGWLACKFFFAKFTNNNWFWLEQRMVFACSVSFPFIHAIIRTKSTAAFLEPRGDYFKFLFAPFARSSYPASLSSNCFPFSIGVKTFHGTKLVAISTGMIRKCFSTLCAGKNKPFSLGQPATYTTAKLFAQSDILFPALFTCSHRHSKKETPAGWRFCCSGKTHLAIGGHGKKNPPFGSFCLNSVIIPQIERILNG